MTNVITSITIAALTILTWSAPVPAHEDDDPPEITHDGLHLLPDAKVAVAWVNPDADFSQYDSFMILETFVSFRKNWQRDHRRVRARDMERIKNDLSAMFGTVWTEVLEDGGYPVVDVPDHNVILIRAAIFDLDVSAPDTMSAGRSRTWVASTGAASLLIELFDSVTGDILARAVDRQSARSFGRMELGSRVSNSRDARRALRHWAGLLVARMDEIHGGGGD